MHNPSSNTLDSLVSYENLFNAIEDHNLNLSSFLPNEFKPYAEDISKIKGSPLKGLIGGMVSCASGLFLYALGGKLAKSFTNLSLLERYTLAASPMLLGGCLRIWAASQADQGQGKKSMLQLLGMSMLGVVGHVMMLSLDLDLSQISTRSIYYYIFLLNNILTGMGIATYSPGMALGAQSAPQDTPEDWYQHLKKSSDIIEHPIHPGFIEHKLSSILRRGSGQYLAMIACASNFAPGLTLISANFLIPLIGIRNTYIFFASMTGLGMLTTYYFVQNSILDQLKQINPMLENSIQKDIATCMGQRIFPLEEPFFQRLHDLHPNEKQEIFKATFDYTVTFGLLTALTAIGPIILENKGASTNTAVLTMAGVSLLSSLMRGLMTLAPNFIKTEHWMRISLAMMLICSIILKYANDLTLIQANMLIFGIFNGIGNFCVVDRVSQKIPQDIGLATGISSGLAAFLAFPISILLAQEDMCFMAICFLGLAYHSYHSLAQHCTSQPHARVQDLDVVENIEEGVSMRTTQL
jgi:nitrate/nitrite transporter NarK